MKQSSASSKRILFYISVLFLKYRYCNILFQIYSFVCSAFYFLCFLWVTPTFLFFQVPFLNASKLHWNTSAVSLKSSFLNIFYTNCQSHWMCRFHLDPAILSWAIPLPFALWQEALNTIVDKGQLCLGGNYWIWKTSVMLKVFKGRKKSLLLEAIYFCLPDPFR